MRISGINPYNLSYKGMAAAAKRQVTIKPAYNYSTEIIMLNSPNNTDRLPRLPQISSKAKKYHHEGAKLYKDMQRIKEQVEARIGFGEDELFEDYGLKEVKVSFNFNTKNNKMQMFERDYQDKLFRVSTFDNKGNMEIAQFNDNSSITAVLYNGETEKIALNQTKNGDGSIAADRIYKYSSGSLTEAQIGYSKDGEGQRNIDEVYDFKKLYQGRWDYNQGYHEHEDELSDDEYKTYQKRYAISLDKKVIAYAQDFLDGHHDGNFKTTAAKFVRKPEYQERFEKSDWAAKQIV